MSSTILPLSALLVTCALSFNSHSNNTTNQQFPLHEAYETLSEADYTEINLGQPVIARFNGCKGQLARKFSAIHPTLEDITVTPIVCKDLESGNVRIARIIHP